MDLTGFGTVLGTVGWFSTIDLAALTQHHRGS
jgi:hypothetical protein